MPELPEVETTRRGIAPHVTGRRVVRIDVYDSRLRWPVPSDLDARMRGRTIERVDRRSKYLLFHAGGAALLVHLGMTGSLRVFRDPPPRRTHDHFDIVLDDGTVLRYHDPRRFGAMLWIASSKKGHPLLDAFGPEPFDPAFDAAYLWRTTRARRAAIKLASIARAASGRDTASDLDARGCHCTSGADGARRDGRPRGRRPGEWTRRTSGEWHPRRRDLPSSICRLWPAAPP